MSMDFDTQLLQMAGFIFLLIFVETFSETASNLLDMDTTLEIFSTGI